MQLLELPPEISKCSQSVLLIFKGTFAAEIHYNIFAKHPAVSLRSSGASKIMNSALPLFLANWTKLPLGQHPGLPDLIKKMADFFSKRLKATSYT